MHISTPSVKRTAKHSCWGNKYLLLLSVVLLFQKSMATGTIGAGIYPEKTETADDVVVAQAKLQYLKDYKVYAQLDYLYICFHDFVAPIIPGLGYNIVPYENAVFGVGTPTHKTTAQIH